MSECQLYSSYDCREKFRDYSEGRGCNGMAFYALPVRPPTVPEGTSRIRFSLTAEIREEEVRKLVKYIK